MKHVTLLAAITLIAFFTGCTQSSKTTKSESTNTSSSALCSENAYYCNSSCPGYTSDIAASSFCTSTSTTSTTCTGTDYYCKTNCAGYNAAIAASSYCPASTTTTSYSAIPADNNRAALYPNGEPSGSCSTASGSGYETRKGTVTVSGGSYYSPDLSWMGVGESEYTSIRYSHNVSAFLSKVDTAKAFIDSDSLLRVRFKPRPQPKPPTGKTWCFGRATGQSADSYGYTKLQFTVALKGTDGILKGAQSVTVGVNSCSSAIDWSATAETGDVIVIRDVYSDSGCSSQSGCTAMKKVRDASCWSMDLEVQFDGSKAF